MEVISGLVDILDRGAPKTRSNHELAKSEFEYFVSSVYEVTEPREIWTFDTITDRTKRVPANDTRVC